MSIFIIILRIIFGVVLLGITIMCAISMWFDTDDMGKVLAFIVGLLFSVWSTALFNFLGETAIEIYMIIVIGGFIINIMAASFYEMITD